MICWSWAVARPGWQRQCMEPGRECILPLSKKADLAVKQQRLKNWRITLGLAGDNRAGTYPGHGEHAQSFGAELIKDSIVSLDVKSSPKKSRAKKENIWESTGLCPWC
jgi:hypothetical protein